MWSTELAWAAIGLARYTHYFSNSTVTYVLKDYGPNWTEVVTAVGSLLAGAGVIFVILGARSTLDQVKLAAQQVKEAEKVRLIALAIEMARRWDDDVIVAVRREIKPLSDQHFDRSTSTKGTPIRTSTTSGSSLPTSSRTSEPWSRRTV